MTSHFQDGGHGAISHRKVLPSGECICRVCPVAAATASNSAYILHSDLLSLNCYD